MIHNDEPISIIEDLDPEPPSRRSAFGKWWEVALGLVLLVGVLTFAGWQTIQQNVQQDNYAAGLQALSHQNWEEAHGRFAAASGYRDADRQAQQAAAKIEERNRQYDAALSFMNKGEWLASLDAIRKVIDIQPGYQTSAEIEKQALSQTRTEALSGTIALRPNATPGGLYIHEPVGWRILPNSDKYSRVQTEGADGWVVYDAPSAGWVPGPSPSPEPDVPNPSDLNGRILMAARLSDISTAHALPLDPSLYAIIASGSTGMWAVEGGYTSYSRLSPVRDIYSGAEGKKFVYQPFNDPAAPTTAITLPAVTDNSVVMALDPNSDRSLVADWSNVQMGATIASDTVTNLYLASSAGGREEVYSLRGGSFMSAQISPNGRYILLGTYAPLSPSTEKQSMLLIDTEQTNAPRTRKLGETIAQIEGGLRFNTLELSWLTAAFINTGPFAGKVLLAQYEVDHYHLRIFDPGTDGDASVDVRVPVENKMHWMILSGSDDRILIAGEDNAADFVRNRVNTLVFVVVSSDGSAIMTKATIGPGTFFENGAIFSDRLVYSTFAYGDTQVTHSIYSLPFEHFNIRGRRPETTFKQTLPMNIREAFANGTYNLRPGLFGYLEGNDLHAQNYPGDIDLVLEHGIARLYNPALFSVGQSWLR